jgi:ADP-ribose pyrophosphatase YjhB (NUDIX family)
MDRFFSKLTAVTAEEVVWLGGAIRLRLEVYLTEEMAPLEYFTSVRAVLFTDKGCAVSRNADGVHVLPGGRREGNEDILGTLRREILEETGCSVTWHRPLARRPRLERPIACLALLPADGPPPSEDSDCRLRSSTRPSRPHPTARRPRHARPALATNEIDRDHGCILMLRGVS